MTTERKVYVHISPFLLLLNHFGNHTSVETVSFTIVGALCVNYNRTDKDFATSGIGFVNIVNIENLETLPADIGRRSNNTLPNLSVDR